MKRTCHMLSPFPVRKGILIPKSEKETLSQTADLRKTYGTLTVTGV